MKRDMDLIRELLLKLEAWPLGLGDVVTISPEEIAISVAAEMIAVRRNAGSNWRSLSLSVFSDEKLRAVLAK